MYNSSAFLAALFASYISSMCLKYGIISGELTVQTVRLMDVA